MLQQATTALSLFLVAAPVALAQDVRVGVFGIFHPHQLTLDATQETIIATAGEMSIFLEPGSTSSRAQIRVSGDFLVLESAGRMIRSKEIRALGRDNGPATFVLGVPGKIQRRYQGTFLVNVADGVAVPVITMDLETAVASVVQAESSAGTPLEALKAQAVVTRSYFVAGKGRHQNFDFCDLTHCQFLREPPNPTSPAATAAAGTRGLVLVYNGGPIAAMFTRSCRGRTRTPAEIGMPTNGYPYFSVVCDYCYQNPTHWSRHVSSEDAAQLFAHGEAGRLLVDRRLGWDAVPSNNFSSTERNGEVILEGVGQGHGIGLCQRGARAMAEKGASFREIIHHYFPNTTVVPLDSMPRLGASFQR